MILFLFFFFNDTATTEIYTLSLHDALPISNTITLEFRSHRWNLAVRQSMFLYAALLLVLGVIAALGLRKLLHIQPRLVLLDR